MIAFNSVGDGRTFNDATMAAAIAELGPQGGRIYAPAGKYAFARPISVNFPAVSEYAFAIDGDRADLTEFYFPSSNGLTINADGQRHSAHVRDLTISTGTQGCIGLSLTNTATLGNFGQ